MAGSFLCYLTLHKWVKIPGSKAFGHQCTKICIRCGEKVPDHKWETHRNVRHCNVCDTYERYASIGMFSGGPGWKAASSGPFIWEVGRASMEAEIRKRNIERAKQALSTT